MARIRSIHYNACKSEKLQAASAEAERCYWRLLPHCDDEGRAEDDARNLRSLMFPIAEPPLPAETVDAWLWELHELGLLIRYEVDGKRYLQVTRWHDFQKPQHAKDSILPEPSVPLTKPHEPSPESAPVVVVGGGEVVGVGDGEGARSLALVVAQAPPMPPIVAVFAAWKETTGHTRAILTPDRSRVIKKALALGYDVNDLIDAVRGWRHDPHCRGENDRHTVYDDIELLLRDAKHIEKFRDLERGQGPAPPPIMPRGSDQVAAVVRALEAKQ